MSTDFTNLNKACPKDPYLLPHIDSVIDVASSFRLLNFMDVYSGYNQIRMSPTDASKTTFMTNINNYYYEVIPFGHKNVGTYQRLMNMVFSSQIGRNLEVYIDEMLFKTQEAGRHIDDLKETFGSIRNFKMILNPDKCTFGVQVGKFLYFMLTHWGIKANPYKCQAIINMRSQTPVKEVQQLTWRISSLSRFLSYAGGKSRDFFTTIKKSIKFRWTEECENVFEELKQFLPATPILVFLK